MIKPWNRLSRQIVKSVHGGCTDKTNSWLGWFRWRWACMKQGAEFSGLLRSWPDLSFKLIVNPTGKVQVKHSGGTINPLVRGKKSTSNQQRIQEEIAPDLHKCRASCIASESAGAALGWRWETVLARYNWIQSGNPIPLAPSGRTHINTLHWCLTVGRVQLWFRFSNWVSKAHWLSLAQITL